MGGDLGQSRGASSPTQLRNSATLQQHNKRERTVVQGIPFQLRTLYESPQDQIWAKDGERELPSTTPSGCQLNRMLTTWNMDMELTN